jgi:dihydrofolate reductase
MRKLVVSEFVSLDGVVEEPGWTFPFESEDKDQYKFDELAAADALLLGRVTYEGFAGAWPQMEEQTGEYGAWMNGYPKHVVSTTLEEPLEWNNSTLIKGDIAEEIAGLKDQPGKDILIFGSGDLVNTLMEQDLIDEYRLMIFPVVVGSGKRLFGEGDTKTLKHVETRTLGSGVVVLTYEPARNREEATCQDR